MTVGHPVVGRVSHGVFPHHPLVEHGIGLAVADVVGHGDDAEHHLGGRRPRACVCDDHSYQEEVGREEQVELALSSFFMTDAFFGDFVHVDPFSLGS